jgi:hypothetical protein
MSTDVLSEGKLLIYPILRRPGKTAKETEKK